MILDCDIGNTRCKWRLSDLGQRVQASGSFAHIDGFSALPEVNDLSRLRIISVVDDMLLSDFKLEVSRYNAAAEYAAVNGDVGVRCAYKESWRLGVDRWSAIVAAYHEFGPSLIVDVGSALTVDVVDADGVHLGGYILPGMELMKSSLLNDTGKVKFSSQSSALGIEFGCSTESAVSAGVLSSHIGSIEVAISEARRQVSSEFAILLTGGGALAVQHYLSSDSLYLPDLVLDGVNWLLP